jgi:hypothetical protein
MLWLKWAMTLKYLMSWLDKHCGYDKIYPHFNEGTKHMYQNYYQKLATNKISDLLNSGHSPEYTESKVYQHYGSKVGITFITNCINQLMIKQNG